MKKFGFALLPLFVLALALSAAAQEGKPITTVKEQTDTIKITVSGDIEIDYIWRSRGLAAYTTRVEQLFAPSARSENTFEGELGVQFDVELSNKVNAVIQIGRERVDWNPVLRLGSFIPFGGAPQVIVQDILIRELHVNINEFVMPGMTLQVGIPTWSFDVRGRGSSFAFDPRHSQTFSRNSGTTEDSSGNIGNRLGRPDELDPMGAVLHYTMDALSLDIVALPMVIEGGPPSGDEALYAADLWFNLDQVGKGSRIGGIAAMSTFSGTNTSIFTLGAGAVIKPEAVQGLEIYGEVYFQFGDAGKTATDRDAEAQGMAFQAGLQFNLGGEFNPWIGFNITMISGDDDDDADDDAVGRFMSYESINDLLIVENMYFGLDWDSNYFALKFSGGVAVSIGGGTNNLELSAILGICRTMEDVQFVTDGATENALGTEFDAKLTWHLTKQASLNAAVGFLFGSDILERMMQDDGYDDEEDSCFLYTIGADLRF